MKVFFKLINNNTKIPEKQTADSSGYDLCSSINTIIPSMETVLIKLGFCLAIEEGYQGFICSRSGIALKHKIIVLNAPGIIDSDYREEIGVLLMNLGKENYTITKGQRIAQIIFNKAELAEIEETKILKESKRKGGWGSTGNL